MSAGAILARARGLLPGEAEEDSQGVRKRPRGSRHTEHGAGRRRARREMRVRRLTLVGGRAPVLYKAARRRQIYAVHGLDPNAMAARRASARARRSVSDVLGSECAEVAWPKKSGGGGYGSWEERGAGRLRYGERGWTAGTRWEGAQQRERGDGSGLTRVGDEAGEGDWASGVDWRAWG
ncbi:hypothetical protein TRAPUB_13183 [Trametes pubescens]|uniref:Uncharacterized protein n=1 Tax=Trametes pubescens TaxID=154538 RepID=A0A1M2VRU8_TRAPU|nr:hypothetical protein TRAPUB_13183 [Trametes pubescens]